jgi:hypothetical protein
MICALSTFAGEMPFEVTSPPPASMQGVITTGAGGEMPNSLNDQTETGAAGNIPNNIAGVIEILLTNIALRL